MLTLLLSYLLLYKYLALFLIVFSIAIIVPLPINLILLATGAFASFGYFNLFVSMAVALSANVGGDMVDYFIARHYGPRIFEKFKIKKHYYFERLEHGVREHARLTIFVTRFVGPFDQLGSLFAGSIGIPANIFLLYDFLGNLVSTCIVLTVGYFAGVYWENFSSLISIIGWIIFVSILLFLITRIFLRRRARARQNSADQI